MKKLIGPVDMPSRSVRISSPVRASPFALDPDYLTMSFRHTDFEPEMNPLLAVDHFRITGCACASQQLTGISAVTYLFEDSKGHHINRDSLGNQRALSAGSLHRLISGKGVTHDHWPAHADADVHGLQFFVDLPGDRKLAEPFAVGLDGGRMPEIASARSRVRVVAGQFGNCESPAVLPQPFTLLDAFLCDHGECEIVADRKCNAWIYVIGGEAKLRWKAGSVVLGQEMAVNATGLEMGSTFSVTSDGAAHFVWLSGVEV